MGAQIAAPLSIAGGIFSGVTSALGASSQNRVIRSQVQAERQAAILQQGQLVDQASVENLKRNNEAEIIAGRLRVSAGEAGTATGGSLLALLRQVDYDQALNDHIAQESLNNALARVGTGSLANQQGLLSHIQNPILAGIGAGISGADAGLRIAGSIDSFQRLNTAVNRTAAGNQDAGTINNT